MHDDLAKETEGVVHMARLSGTDGIHHGAVDGGGDTRPRTRGGGGFAIAETAVLDKLVSAALQTLSLKEAGAGAESDGWGAGGSRGQAEVLRWDESEDDGNPDEVLSEEFSRGVSAPWLGYSEEGEGEFMGAHGSESVGMGLRVLGQQVYGGSGSSRGHNRSYPCQETAGPGVPRFTGTFALDGSSCAPGVGGPGAEEEFDHGPHGQDDLEWIRSGRGWGGEEKRTGLGGLRRGRAPLRAGAGVGREWGGVSGQHSLHRGERGGTLNDRMVGLAVSMEMEGSMCGLGRGARVEASGGGGGGELGVGVRANRRPASGTPLCVCVCVCVRARARASIGTPLGPDTPCADACSAANHCCDGRMLSGLTLLSVWTRPPSCPCCSSYLTLVAARRHTHNTYLPLLPLSFSRLAAHGCPPLYRRRCVEDFLRPRWRCHR